jgi:hypothetical protein
MKKGAGHTLPQFHCDTALVWLALNECDYNHPRIREDMEHAACLFVLCGWVLMCSLRISTYRLLSLASHTFMLSVAMSDSESGSDDNEQSGEGNTYINIQCG